MGMNNIGQALKRIRKAAGFRSQAALADASGVEQATISRIEGGKTIPETTTIEKLAEACGVAFDDLYSGTGKAPAGLRPKVSKTAMRVAEAFDRLKPSQKPMILRALGLTVVGETFDKLTVDEEKELENAEGKRQGNEHH